MYLYIVLYISVVMIVEPLYTYTSVCYVGILDGKQVACINKINTRHGGNV